MVHFGACLSAHSISFKLKIMEVNNKFSFQTFKQKKQLTKINSFNKPAFSAHRLDVKQTTY